MINTKRFNGESEPAYIYRIANMRDELGGWQEVADILNAELGYNRTESAYRKPVQYYEQYANAMRNEDVEEKIEKIELKMIELKKERQKLQDVRTEYNKMCREMAREEEILEVIGNYLESNIIEGLDYKPNVISKSTNNALLISLNDIHYGATHDNYWGVYNPDICRNMMRGYLDRIREIAKVHKPIEAVVWMNGDAISGNIHETVKLSNKENVVDQVINVSNIIIDFLTELSKTFSRVRYCSVAGNHSRITQKEFAPKGERLDDLVEEICKKALQNNKRVVFNDYEKIDDTMYIVNVMGNNCIGVHGDYDPTPSKVALLPSMVGRPVDVILTAHMHHNSTDTINGVNIIMAGSFQGMDDYCVERRIIGYPEQMVTVINNKGILCNYGIDLSEYAHEE